MIHITDDNGLSFKLNTKNHTAIIVKSNFTKNDLYIPRTINYLNEEYVITEMDDPFQSKSLKSLTFAEDSEIRKFGAYLFFGCDIEKISIPPKVNKISKKWCLIEKKLTTVILSPNNPNFKYLDDSHEIILSKSQPDSIFDTIFFACRNIERVTIPPYIKHIFPYAFDSCHKILQKL